MGLFSKKAPPAPPVAPTPPVVAGQRQSGKISLAKGSSVTIAKTPLITARVTWSSKTDYDIYALVLLRDGSVLTVSQFGSEAEPNFTPSVLGGAVKHLGDIGRGVKGVAEEVIEIRLTDDIETIYPIAYSAQSNGTGSFRTYKVGLSISTGDGTDVVIDASSASADKTIYSVAIGAIRNTPTGVVVEALERYSTPSSEFRPAIVKGEIVMDKGPKNLYK
ncbi:MAG: tellurium resistance protein [Glaciihabitans sp.]|nr:tellurium resistance protein [Glaciihabitans sp.]